MRPGMRAGRSALHRPSLSRAFRNSIVSFLHRSSASSFATSEDILNDLIVVGIAATEQGSSRMILRPLLL